MLLDLFFLLFRFCCSTALISPANLHSRSTQFLLECKCCYFQGSSPRHDIGLLCVLENFPQHPLSQPTPCQVSSNGVGALSMSPCPFDNTSALLLCLEHRTLCFRALTPFMVLALIHPLSGVLMVFEYHTIPFHCLILTLQNFTSSQGLTESQVPSHLFYISLLLPTEKTPTAVVGATPDPLNVSKLHARFVTLKVPGAAIYLATCSVSTHRPCSLTSRAFPFRIFSTRLIIPQGSTFAGESSATPYKQEPCPCPGPGLLLVCKYRLA